MRAGTSVSIVRSWPELARRHGVILWADSSKGSGVRRER